MIHKLHEDDRPLTLGLLAHAPEWAVYKSANLDAYGFDRPECTFWGDFSSDGTLRGVANRFGTGWGIYGLPNADWPALVALVDDDPAASRLQDNPGGVPSLLPLLQRHRASRAYDEELMRLDADSFRPAQAKSGLQARMACDEDLAALSTFYGTAGSMARTSAATARALHNGGIALLEQDGDILAAVLVHARTRQHAMIGGVYTLPEARGRGFSSAVCSVLCADILASGRTPLLYWQHADAGAVYRKLGFIPIGRWRSLWLEQIQDED